jgi:hypothetical protein
MSLSGSITRFKFNEMMSKLILLDRTADIVGVGVWSVIGFFVVADACGVSLSFGIDAPGLGFCCLAALWAS